MNAPKTARARARIELTREIKAAAKRQLAEVGAPGLSLRAIARELGMASSAIYRYFPGRDELLTALITDAYDEVGQTAEAATAATVGLPFAERWLVLASAIRDWANANRHEYALIYGSPVPGYAAPQDTVAPAVRVTMAMLDLLVDAVATGDVVSLVDQTDPDGALGRIRLVTGSDLPNDVISRGVAAWTQLFGHLSFELFSQFHTIVEDYDAFFEAQMTQRAETL